MHILPLVCKLFNKYVIDNAAWCKNMDIKLSESLINNKKFKKVLTEYKFNDVRCDIYTWIQSFNYFSLITKLTIYDDYDSFSNENISYLSEFKNLVDLTLDCCDILTDISIDVILKIRTLEYIKLNYCGSITDSGLYKLASMPLKQLIVHGYREGSYMENINTSKLETIYFKSRNEKYLLNFMNKLQNYELIKKVCLYAINVDKLSSSLSKVKLKELELYDPVHTKGYFIKHLNCEYLENLSLDCTNIKNKYLVQLLNKSTKLIRLEFINKNHLRNVDTILPCFLKLINLNYLALMGWNIINKLFLKLQNTKLQCLDLYDCDIKKSYENLKDLKLLRYVKIDNATDDFLSYLKGLNLTKLSLRSSPIIGDGLFHLINMPLNNLELNETNITDEHLIHIKDHKLEILDLACCDDITPKCFQFFSTMPLERLCIEYCRNITEKDIELFNKLYDKYTLT
jgi:hypothetical protein